MKVDARGLDNAVESYSSRSPERQVAWACRILASEGFSDLTLGHASVRPPGPDVIFIKRKGPALEEVNPVDVVTVEYRNDAALATPGLHLETAMHTAVYRARADVGAVIHAHPPYATALGATGLDWSFSATTPRSSPRASACTKRPTGSSRRQSLVMA